MIVDAAAFRDELLRVFALNELEGCLSDEKVDLLTAFALRLAAENEKYNLTALSTPGDMILRHFADCAALIPHLPETGKALDVGCGAGFPSLVLAILCPTLSVTALDATEKKVRFVAGCADEFGIANLQTLIGRAETLAASVPFREAFDLVTARAVARLPVLSELCLPFVSVGGTFLAMKGPLAERESEEAKRAIPMLGGRIAGIFSRALRDGNGEPLRHAAVKIDKIRPTPSEYPRAYARILKKPL